MLVIESLESRQLLSASFSGTHTVDVGAVDVTVNYSLTAGSGGVSASATVTGTVAGQTVNVSRSVNTP
jgi:hypothetical protein